VPLPQLGLSIAFSFGIPMAFAPSATSCLGMLGAVRRERLLHLRLRHRIRHVDRDDDRAVGIHTSALTLGRHDVTAVMASYALMIGILFWFAIVLPLAWPFHAGLLVAAGICSTTTR